MAKRRRAGLLGLLAVAVSFVLVACAVSSSPPARDGGEPPGAVAVSPPPVAAPPPLAAPAPAPPPPTPAPPPPVPAPAQESYRLADIPAFPTPVPKPSSTTDVTLASLSAATGDATLASLGDIDDALVHVLDPAGYTERRYFSFPGGYVALTRIESIEDNGAPTPQRWNIDNPNEFDATLKGYLRAVFKAPARHSRFIAFVVTDRPLRTTQASPTLSVLQNVYGTGVVDALPDSLRKIGASSQTRCHVLIYEFEKVPGAKDAHAAKQVFDLPATQHLIAAKLSPPLKTS